MSFINKINAAAYNCGVRQPDVNAGTAAGWVVYLVSRLCKHSYPKSMVVSTLAQVGVTFTGGVIRKCVTKATKAKQIAEVRAELTDLVDILKTYSVVNALPGTEDIKREIISRIQFLTKELKEISQ